MSKKHMMSLSPLPLLRYDGLMVNLHQFTEIDPTVASYGASFYINQSEFTMDRLNQRRQEKRTQFEQGK